MHIINHFDLIVNNSNLPKCIAQSPRYSRENSELPKLDSHRLKVYTVAAIKLAEEHNFRVVLRGKMTNEMPFNISAIPYYTVNLKEL